jgi:recombination protein RecA
MVKEEKISKVDEVVKELNKKYGNGTIMSGVDFNEHLEVVDSGSLTLNIATNINGIPLGKVIEIMGPESCLSGDTFIKYRTLTKDGKYQNSKGNDLKTFYEKFNNLKITRKGKKHSKNTFESYYTVPCINEQNRITHIKVKNVLYNGKKEVYKIILSNGFEIKSTLTHKFYNGSNFIELSNLTIGDRIHIHNNTTYKVDEYMYKYYKEIYVKYHPKWKSRIVNNCLYYRSPVSRAVYEASLNNLSYLEYIKVLNSGNKDVINNLIYIPNNYHIHHIDENQLNNDLNNLMLITPSEHGKLHATERHNNLRFITVPEEIIDIQYIGEEDVYDIQCEDPYHNYIANNFVVHNCGKSTLCLHIIAEFQKVDKVCALVDQEQSFDKHYAKSLGVNTEKLLISQPDCQEDAYNIIISLIEKGVSLIVFDSHTASLPRKVIDGEVGDATIGLQARNNSTALGKLKGILNKNSATLISISQLRTNIGGYGDPNVSTGGNAYKFYSDMRFKVSKQLDKANNNNKTTVEVIKNKCGAPFGKAEFLIQWGEGIDRLQEIIDLSVEYKFINKAGAGWYTLETGNKIQGDVNLKQFLSDNIEYKDELEKRVLEKINSK